ncbi:hypothetical protein DPMN_009384 [Dreissena polymorpha]|uniref:Uncharacterized protein n=1 Tax=Dreissena polymorpha TaxID=45954 RepID=A0A9D4RY09_DREPO|nr:hypothetical protein DPMN_009384 [Dreissena polymorpha]
MRAYANRVAVYTSRPIKVYEDICYQSNCRYEPPHPRARGQMLTEYLYINEPPHPRARGHMLTE